MIQKPDSSKSTVVLVVSFPQRTLIAGQLQIMTSALELSPLNHIQNQNFLQVYRSYYKRNEAKSTEDAVSHKHFYFFLISMW